MSAEHSQPSTVFLSLNTILQMGVARYLLAEETDAQGGKATFPGTW